MKKKIREKQTLKKVFIKDTGKNHLNNFLIQLLGSMKKKNTIDSDSWSDPYGDERAYYDGWSREDVESGLADAYE